MFKNYQVFEITRPFWNHPQVQEDLSRHWKLSGNFKKKECKGNRNDLNENKIKNFIFVKIWPENLATTDWSFAGHLSILCDFWMVILHIMVETLFLCPSRVLPWQQTSWEHWLGNICPSLFAALWTNLAVNG